MQRISEVERCALEPKGFSDDGGFVPVTVPQEGWTQGGKRRIFSYKALVDSRRRDENDRRSRENLLEGTGVMVGVAVSDNNANDHAGTDTLPSVSYTHLTLPTILRV